MVSKVHRGLTRSQKDEILERDAFRCIYCGNIATVVDHILPWDWSHNDDPINLVAACNICNWIASDLIFDSLAAKAKYIRKTRNNRKWSRRLISMYRTNYCLGCGDYFFPCVKGATNFLCRKCAIKDGYIVYVNEGM